MLKNTIVLSLLSLALSGCALFDTFGTDNTPAPAPLPLSSKTTGKVLWTHGVGNGSDGGYLRLSPAYANGLIYTVDASGDVQATNLQGHKVFQHDLHNEARSGVGTNGEVLATVDVKGQLAALNAHTGQLLWRTQAANLVLAAPTVTADTLYIKTIDGTVAAYRNSDGQLLWSYNHPTPALVLRASSPVLVVGQTLYAGFSDGQVVALKADNGNVLWEQTVANPNGVAEIQRIVDIDGQLLMADGLLFAATYQGQVAAVQVATGHLVWQQTVSTYTDMAYVNHQLIVPEADGTVQAFNSRDGHPVWQQKALAWRFLTGAAVLDQQILLGDLQGYVHSLDAASGQYLSRVQPTTKALYSTPLVVGQTVYVQDSAGTLAAFLR